MISNAAKPAVSPLRLAANRANARKSTGPRTEAGKRASSQNARKTPPCPFTFQLPPHFAAEWFHDALRRTAASVDGRARLLLINRCMLQAHELRWHAIERTLFDTACLETDGSADQAALWLAQRTSAAQGLLSYHRWIARRINRVERCLAGLAAQSAHVEEAIEAEAPKTMAAGAGGGSTFSQLSPSDLGPEGTLPITYSNSGWSYGGLSGMFGIRVGAPQPPRPPQPPKPPTVGPIRGRYRLYLRCPAAPEPPNEARMSQSAVAPPPPAETHSIERSQSLSSSRPEQPDAQPRRSEDQFENQKDHASHPLVLREQDAFTVNSSMPPAIPGKAQIANPPQQPELRPHHSPRHRRGPIPTTTTPEPTPTQPQPNLSSEDRHPSQPPVPREENSIPPSSSIPGKTQISNPPQQPEPPHHHYPRHRRGPTPTTTTPEPTPTQPQPNLSSEDSHPSQPPVPREGNSIPPSSSIPGKTQISNSPQQPEPHHHHYPRHRRGPIPTTTTPEPTPTQPQPNLSSEDNHPSQPAAHPARNSTERSQPAAPSNDGSRLPSMQASDPATIQPIEPNRQTGVPPPGKTAHSPPVPSA